MPAGSIHRAEFTLGVPFNKNHTDLTTQPSPLNLTALSWVWNAGRKFARLDFSSTGRPRGYAVHLGSTGCTPNRDQDHRAHAMQRSKSARKSRSRISIPGNDIVIADLAGAAEGFQR